MRPDWPEYFMSIARVAATRATCDRAHVGCVLAKGNQILATGYNGSLPGAPHCDDVGHLMVDEHCLRTVHAEANTVAQAARFGTAIDGATAFVTHYPCLHCIKLLAAAGVTTIIFDAPYHYVRPILPSALLDRVSITQLEPQKYTVKAEIFLSPLKYT